MFKKKAPQKEFTLTEMLVVIAIISILAGLMLPALRSANESGKTVKCQSNMKNLGLAGLLYSQDSNNYWPLLFNGTWSQCYVNNATFAKLYMGDTYVPVISGAMPYMNGDFSMPPEFLCPSNEHPLINGLARAYDGYPMSRQGLVDAGIPLWSNNFAYKLDRVESPSRKLIHIEGKNFHVYYGSANPANATVDGGVNYIHNNNSFANTLFFDGHVSLQSFVDLYKEPRTGKDCWDSYDKK